MGAAGRDRNPGIHLCSVGLVLMAPDRNRDSGLTRDTRKSLGYAQTQLLAPERIFESSPPSRLRSVSTTEAIAGSRQVLAFYPKTVSCLYLCPTSSVSWLMSILPFQQCQQHLQLLLGSPARDCNSTCKISLLEQCSWNGNAVMEAIPKHSVLQEFGAQLTLKCYEQIPLFPMF